MLTFITISSANNFQNHKIKQGRIQKVLILCIIFAQKLTYAKINQEATGILYHHD